jgi:hypothetical protein
MRSFLVGRWSLFKTIDYRIGGGKATVEGTATIQAIDSSRPEILLYEERGAMTMENIQQPMEVYRFYCFDTSAWPVKVCFVDDPTKAHLPPVVTDLDIHTSFFHNLAPVADNASFSHLCVDDLYSGDFVARSAETFQWNWSVIGPAKDGRIHGHYTKLESVVKEPSL